MTATLSRRSFLSGGIWAVAAMGAAGFAAANVAMSIESAVRVQPLAVPELGEVHTGTHAVDRHGLDALRVRAIMATAPPDVLHQPPCKSDGRYRIVMPAGRDGWAVWVLQKINEVAFVEITAFLTPSQDYVRALRDDCGNGGWFQGHDGMGLAAKGGPDGQEGASIVTATTL